MTDRIKLSAVALGIAALLASTPPAAAVDCSQNFHTNEGFSVAEILQLAEFCLNQPVDPVWKGPGSFNLAGSKPKPQALPRHVRQQVRPAAVQTRARARPECQVFRADRIIKPHKTRNTLGMAVSGHFRLNDHTLNDAMRESLRSNAVVMLQHYPRATVTVIGHADASGGDYINDPLSERRAYAGVQALIRAGVPPHRIKYDGRGARALRADLSPCDPQQRRLQIILKMPGE